MRYTALSSVVVTLVMSGCTGQIPASFRLAQQNETFNYSQSINTKIDMLWVVDNSASMDVSQKALRNGFETFAKKYMRPTWDIRMAAITTDTYLANPAFAPYLASTAENAGYQSTYLNHQLSSPPGGTESPVNASSNAFTDPNYANWIPGTINATGKFTQKMTVGQLYPSWGPNWGLLLPGNHDGPMTTLCYERSSYFFFGESQCFIRDNSANRDSSHCLNPAGAEDSTTQCVNTFANDTVHSGIAIVNTQPPVGVAPDQAWVHQLADQFILNASTGSSGSGSERGFSSVLELLKDNESPLTRKAAAHPFFRQGSLRLIVFLSDEDDQTISLEASDPLDPAPLTPATPFSGYIQSASNCPVAPNSPQTANCCATKTVDGYTYTIPVCPIGYPVSTAPTAGAVLMPVDHVKTKIDTFFSTLDSLPTGTPQQSYFVAAIVMTNGQSIKALREAKRCPEQTQIFGHCDPYRDASSDRGDRYIALTNLVGNGSLAIDLNSPDYSPVLDTIGQSILQKKSTFTLTRAPTTSEDTIVTIMHQDGTTQLVTAAHYAIAGNNLTITDQDLLLSLSSTDQITINYQPKTLL